MAKLKLIVTFSLTGLLVLSYQNCGLRTPKGMNDSASLSGFNHKLVEGQQCMTCHESDRPVETPTHGGGGDCIDCHSPEVAWNDLSGGSVHSPVPKSCNQCHGSAAKYNSFPTDHIAIGASDCKSCHSSTVSGGFKDWKNAAAIPHPALGATAGNDLNCLECHGNTGVAVNKLSVTAANHYFEATNCTGCHSDFSDFKTKLNYDHATQVQSGNCLECHNFGGGSYSSFTQVATFNITGNFTIGNNQAVSGSFDGDSFNLPHANANMGLCSSCHEYTEPANATTNVWRFVHRPRNPGVPRYNQNQASGVQGCNTCH